MKKKFHYIIVGQGVAGTLLHAELLKRGKTSLVIDNNFNYNSSLVAAGMYNPIVFKRLNKSWMADDLLPALISFYDELGDKLQKKIRHEVDMIRIFSSMEQQNDWSIRSQELGYEKYLTNEKVTDLDENDIEAPFGYGVLKHAGWVDLKTLLYSYREFLRSRGELCEAKCDYDELKIDFDYVSYKDIEATGIIFCEGNQVRHNPYFNALPFTLTKGEVLDVDFFTLNTKKVLNKGFFMLPQKNNIYKVGATYNWRDKTDKPTKEGKQELQQKIAKIWDKEYRIMEHKAGVRPTTKDRRPIIGEHPHKNNVYLFNGLGTKGVMIAPYFIRHFCDVLLNGEILNKEVDLRRFDVFERS